MEENNQILYHKTFKFNKQKNAVSFLLMCYLSINFKKLNKT